MHLINVHTLGLEEFFPKNAPPYAILSHRWGADELNFKDVLKKRADTSTRGYRKLYRAAEVAASYKLDYLWIDTCCIDKKSSAELSEAINSMYAWYKMSDVCITYLEDVDWVDASTSNNDFRNSVWFTRSWTLQELIAPSQVHFFDANWKHMGSTEEHAQTIQEVTGIPPGVMNKSDTLTKYSIAQKMSWAAQRKATREEDLTYSLLGIFDVNMPLIYGEGKKAFLRLQEQIISRTRDPTFLLWGLNHDSSRCLAQSPSDFTGLGSVASWKVNKPITVSVIGVEIKTTLIRLGYKTYGLVLGMNVCASNRLAQHRSADENAVQDYTHWVLLVDMHKSVGWANMTRIGVRLTTVSYAHLRTRLLTLIDLGNHDLWNNFTKADRPNLFAMQILVEAEVPVAAVEVRSKSRKIEYVSFENDTKRCFKYDFGVKETQPYLWVQMSSGSCTGIYLFFDFDCNACAVINQTDDFSGLGTLDLWSVSEGAENANKTHNMMHNSSGESWMIEVMDGQAAFFRASSELWPIWAPVPDKFRIGDTLTWIYFVPPSYNIDKDTRAWSFRIMNQDMVQKLKE